MMDANFSRDGKMKKRTRWKCSLCNEPRLDAHEQIRHYTSTLHKHMKQIKQKQHSYTKNLRTLDEKIKASEQKEPLIGLEYIYQYGADRRGVVPYVCTLCDCVFKIDTIFFHIAGIKHRSLYLGKNFPVMGIDSHFRAKSPSDCRKLLNAAEIIERSHGRKKINVFNTMFNPKKNSGIIYDSESGDEGLSSSEEEQDNPDSNSVTTNARPLHTDEWATLRGGVGDTNQRSVDRRGNLPFQHDYVGGSSLPNVGKGNAAFWDDERRGPELPDGQGDMNPPLRKHKDFGFQHGGHSDLSNLEDNDKLAMEVSYQQRGPNIRKIPGRTDFSSHRNPSHQMHRDGIASQYEEGPMLQTVPRHADKHVRNNNRDFAFQHDQATGLLGNPHGNSDMPSMGKLHLQVDCDGIKSHNRTPSYPPPGFPGDHSFQSQIHKGERAFQHNDREAPRLRGSPRHADHQVGNNDFAFQSTRSLDNPHDDLNMPSSGSLRQHVDRKDTEKQNGKQNRPPDFPGGHNFSSGMHRDGTAFQYDTDNHLENDDCGFAFQNDPNMRLLGNAHSDLSMPSVGPSRHHVNRDDIKSQNSTQNHPSGFFGDRNVGTSVPHDRITFQYDRKETTVQGGSRHADSEVKKNSHSFGYNHDQSKDPPNMPSMRPLYQVNHDDLKGQKKTQSHPPGFHGDQNPQSQMHRAGSTFQYGDRGGPMSQGGPRNTDSQVKNYDHDFAYRHNQGAQSRANTHGDPNMPSMGLLRHQIDHEDLKGQSRTHNHPLGVPGDRSLQSQGHRGGMGFGYEDISGGEKEEKSKGGSSCQLDRQRERPLPKVCGDRDVPSMKSFYRQGDPHTFEERSSTNNSYPGFSSDPSLHSPKHRGRMVHDSRSLDDIRCLRRRDGTAFQDLQALRKSDPGQENSLDEQGVNYDSDMEVRSMDLSDCDGMEFLCNADLFAFLRTFKILSYEDEQFALKVRDLFTDHSAKYKQSKEGVLKRRIPEEKERLEEEKKAFLQIQRSKERPKPSTTSSSKRGQLHPPRFLGQKGSKAEQRLPTVPSMNKHPGSRSRWNQESVRTASETCGQKRPNPLPRRADPFSSRGRSTRNFQPGFPTQSGSVKY